MVLEKLEGEVKDPNVELSIGALSYLPMNYGSKKYEVYTEELRTLPISLELPKLPENGRFKGSLTPLNMDYKYIKGYGSFGETTPTKESHALEIVGFNNKVYGIFVDKNSSPICYK